MRTTQRLVIGLSLCLGAVILSRHGLDWLGLIAAIAFGLATVSLAKQFALSRAADHVAEYELNLLARLDDPDPSVRNEAEIERELRSWQFIRGAGEAS